MNYQDMLKLAKGDRIRACTANGWAVGEVVGSQAGAEPSIWVATSSKVRKVNTGANFTESGWYSLRSHLRIQFEDDEREQASLESR